MTTSAASLPSARLCDCCRHHLTAEPADMDRGFGYSRTDADDPASATAEPIPAGVELFFFTGRTLRRAAA